MFLGKQSRHCTRSKSTLSIPTNNRQEDHYKVKDVPADGEKVAAESEDLNNAFSGEDDNESQVDMVEDGLHLRRMLIRLQHHGDHVQDDEHHDGNVKGLFGDQVKEEPLHNILNLKTRQMC